MYHPSNPGIFQITSQKRDIDIELHNTRVNPKLNPSLNPYFTPLLYPIHSLSLYIYIYLSAQTFELQKENIHIIIQSLYLAGT